MFIHTVFDILAWLVALVALFVLRRTWFRNQPVAEPLRLGYAAAVLFGAGLGAVVLGTANLWAAGMPGFARSVEGALAGAILAVELWKKANGVNARTGAVYALPLALGVAVGRIGCLLAGLEDFTHGVPTGAAWGWDFGDGVPRHPVQLYESVAMAAFAAWYVAVLARASAGHRLQPNTSRQPHAGLSGSWLAFRLHRDGFYIAVAFYAAQRFAWEFLKPYPAVFAGMTVFQWLSLALFGYAAVMLATARGR